MKNSSINKAASFAGTISVVLMIIGALLFGAFDYLPQADRLQIIFGENPDRVTISGYVGSLSAFFLIWFSVGFYNVLKKAEEDKSLLPVLSLVGGSCSGIALFVSYSAIISAGARAGTAQGINPAEAFTLYDFYSHIMGQMFAITLAMFIGAGALVSMRSGIFPAWAGWLSLLIALGLLSPVGYIVIGLGPVWLLFVSFWMFAQKDAAMDMTLK